MSRLIPITTITKTSAGRAGFTFGAALDEATGDWTPVFLGKFFRLLSAAGPTPDAGDLDWYIVAAANAANLPAPLPLDTPPAGYQLVAATQFDVVQNARYSGRYTVFTRTASLSSSGFALGQTTVYVNETIGPENTASDLTSGFITNVSTYYLLRPSAVAVVVSPNTEVSTLPLTLAGRSKSGWGEVFSQNAIRHASNFAGATAPGNPFIGMMWYDTVSNLMMVWDGAWSPVNGGSSALTGASRTSHALSTTWTVTHSLGSAFPLAPGASLGLVHSTFIVDTGGGMFAPIIPSTVTYDSADQLTVTFSTPYAGWALVRL
jgi:hypothetical protein